ncbi:MAG: hypothetical protein HRT74_09105 [Flavobacteriales bacterium]|nr:hypothetical protein [Flavobacteriales bacterium]
MEKIEPYNSANEAMEALDNGGRFYNFWTKADDGKITKAELAKVAGVFDEKQRMILFLEMATKDLRSSEKDSILECMDDNLRKHYRKLRPVDFVPGSEESIGEKSQTVIVKGTPKFIESKDQLESFIFITNMVANVPVMVPVPLVEVYNVYELLDQDGNKLMTVAHKKGKEKLPEQAIEIGGMLKEKHLTKEAKGEKDLFLEGVYWK